MASVRVEVVDAARDRQAVVLLRLPEGTTAGQALTMSGLPGTGCIGIGGKLVEPGRVLRDGDRVDILRPLALDPRESRRRRANASRRSRKR